MMEPDARVAGLPGEPKYSRRALWLQSRPVASLVVDTPVSLPYGERRPAGDNVLFVGTLQLGHSLRLGCHWVAAAPEVMELWRQQSFDRSRMPSFRLVQQGNTGDVLVVLDIPPSSAGLWLGFWPLQKVVDTFIDPALRGRFSVGG